MTTLVEYPYVWYWKATPWRPIDRKGQRCRIVIRSKRMNSILVEFPDGFWTITSRFAVRLAKGSHLIRYDREG